MSTYLTSDLLSFRHVGKTRVTCLKQTKIVLFTNQFGSLSSRCIGKLNERVQHPCHDKRCKTAYTTTILYECIALAIGDLVYLVLYVRNREQRTYTVSEKRSTLHSILGITLTNLDSFVIFGANHPDTSVY